MLTTSTSTHAVKGHSQLRLALADFAWQSRVLNINHRVGKRPDWRSVKGWPSLSAFATWPATPASVADYTQTGIPTSIKPVSPG
jgi:hypothetical protein